MNQRSRMQDVMLERIERELDAVLAAPFEALRAVKDDGRPDYAMRLRGFEVIRDTAFGKPRQATELSAPVGSALQVAQLVAMLERPQDRD
jgi:hypothetical protein